RQSKLASPVAASHQLPIRDPLDVFVKADLFVRLAAQCLQRRLVRVAPLGGPGPPRAVEPAAEHLEACKSRQQRAALFTKCCEILPSRRGRSLAKRRVGEPQAALPHSRNAPRTHAIGG